jgi:hypothetical protein
MALQMIQGVFPVLQVGMRKYRQAVLDGDAVAQSRHAASLTALRSTWLTVEYAAWQAAGFPTIP